MAHAQVKSSALPGSLWGLSLLVALLTTTIVVVAGQGTGQSLGPGPYRDDQYVAMCLIVRDQHADILEWVEHYLKLGVRRIYLYDHGSRPMLLPVVAHYEMAGLIVYHWFTNDMMDARRRPYLPHADGSRSAAMAFNPQMWVYQECLDRYRHRHRWMAFFDSDEFLLLKDRKVKDLPTFLKNYEAYGGLAVRWMSFGSSGHLTRPNGTTLASYWKCSKSRHVKVIANTRYCLGPHLTPHEFLYGEKKYAVTADLAPVQGSRSMNGTYAKVVLNHYCTKSKEQFLAKSLRGSGDSDRKAMWFFEAADAAARRSCRGAVRMMKGRTFNLSDIS